MDSLTLIPLLHTLDWRVSIALVVFLALTMAPQGRIRRSRRTDGTGRHRKAVDAERETD